MKIIFVILALSSTVAPVMQAWAQTAAACAANDGAYLSGTVTRKAYFEKASETIDGVQLSHTHVTLKSAANSKSYDVAIDNVFNPTWVKNSSKVPMSLTALTVGTHLSLCGLLYTSGGLGIHWVHNSCNQTSPSNPNGWTEIVTNGVVGSNLENSQTYCYLFGE